MDFSIRLRQVLSGRTEHCEDSDVSGRNGTQEENLKFRNISLQHKHNVHEHKY